MRRLRSNYARSLRIAVIAAFGATLFTFAATPVSAAEGDDDDDWGDVEEVQKVEEVATPSESGEAGDQDGAVATIGRFHPAVVHFPIAWLVLVLLLDLATFVLGREDLSKAGLCVLAGAVLSFGPALLTGLFREDTYAMPERIQEIIETHEAVMLTMAAVTVVALVLRLARKNRLEGMFKAGYLLLIVVATGLVTYGGHLGGTAVYGEGFLPF